MSQIHMARGTIRKQFGNDWRIPIMKGFVTIQTEDIENVPLVPNPVQMELMDMIWQKWINDEPVRIIIPKPRRDGISTICEAIIYCITAFSDSYSSFILGYDDDNAKTIFEMTQRIHRNMESFIKTKTRASNAHELIFSETDSKIVIGSARKGEIRGKGIHAFHGSEVAYYPNAKRILKALLPSIPYKPKTIILMESTGNGKGNWFEKTCEMAEKGKGAYTLFFIPWWKSVKNQMPLPDGYELVPEEFGAYGDEIDEQRKYNLTPEQLYWRRHTIDSVFQGDIEAFKPEYPACLEECFLGTGSPVFDLNKLKAMQTESELPKWYGTMGWNETTKKGRITIQKQQGGYLRVWDKPELGWHNRYVISADTGGVSDGADYSSAYVRDRLTRRTVAAIHGHINPTEYARMLVTLARWYDNALLAVECNKWDSETDDFGLTVIDKIQNECKYNNFYTREEHDEITDQTTTKIGFHMNSKTKPMVVNALLDFVREYTLNNQIIFEADGTVQMGASKIIYNDYDLLEEMKTYIILKTPTGKTTWGAEEGYHDDRVMSFGINLVVSQSMGPVTKKEDIEIKKTNNDPVSALI